MDPAEISDPAANRSFIDIGCNKGGRSCKWVGGLRLNLLQLATHCLAPHMLQVLAVRRNVWAACRSIPLTHALDTHTDMEDRLAAALGG